MRVWALFICLFQVISYRTFDFNAKNRTCTDTGHQCEEGGVAFTLITDNISCGVYKQALKGSFDG